MVASRNVARHGSILFLIWLLVCQAVFAQNPAPKSDDVVRVFTELVQTDVMVFDKQGKFVNGLTKDKFEIKIDGQVRPIEFFEQVSAGSSNEEAQLAAARGITNTGPTRVVPLDRGRTVFFYVDDFHLDPRGFVSSRKTMSDFVDKEMGQNDQAAIASASGQIGFLQQMTTDHTVLHSAIDRLSARSYSVTDADRPHLTEYEAMMIDNNDYDLFEFFITATIRDNPGLTREMAGSIVQSRCQAILAQAAAFNSNTLIGLERLVRIAKDLPGRKVLFFLSNGFLIHNKRGDAIDKLQRITSAAARSGVVIYSIDTRGLTAPMSDITMDQPLDTSGVLARATHGENLAVQDGLNALAKDTGGKMIINTNDFTVGIKGALKETAVYYLLAWKPDPENKKPGRFRNVQVSVVNRPDLSVRVRKGFFDIEPTPKVAEAAESTPVSPDEENKIVVKKLREAITAAYPRTAIPLSLGLNYYDTAAKGATVAASVQIPGEFLEFGPRNGKTQAIADLTGVFFDEKGVGKASFYERLVTTVKTPEDAVTYHGDITYTYPASLAPGLYQVRVAVRDDKSGRTGSAHSWIEVPDLAKRKLVTSSLLLGERTQSMMKNVSNNDDEINPVLLNAAHRFRADSTLRFLVFAYNATSAQTNQQPDVAVQVQVIRDDQPVLTTALRKVATDGLPDLLRLPYAAEIPLSGLQPGRYVLQVAFIDRLSKQSASRQTQFDIY